MRPGTMDSGAACAVGWCRNRGKLKSGVRVTLPATRRCSPDLREACKLA